MKALVIKTNGECVISDSEWEYSQINATVGGWIEGLSLNGAGYMYVNEEGKLRQMPVNNIATEIVINCYNGKFNDFIVGDVVVFGPNDLEGNDTEVLDSLIKYVKSKGWIE